jgi:hypothetical protein
VKNFLGPRPDFRYCQTFAVLSIWGALSDDRTGLSVVVTVIRTCHLYLQLYLPAFYIVICKGPAPFRFMSFTNIFVMAARVESRLVLRPTVSRPVCLRIKHPSGAYDQILITVKQLRVC